MATKYGTSAPDVIQADDGDLNAHLFGYEADAPDQGPTNDNDTLIGGDGGDTLHGGSGSNTMTGGNGNDSYFVSSLTDTIIEESQTINPRAGYLDRIYLADGVSSPTNSYTMPDYVEMLEASGSSDAFLIGNSTSNVNAIYGADGDDTIIGMNKLDVLQGGKGDDTLDAGAGYGEVSGGAGNDTYIIKKSDTVAGGQAVSDGFMFQNAVIISDNGLDESNPGPSENTLILQGFQSSEVLFLRSDDSLIIADTNSHIIASISGFYFVDSYSVDGSTSIQIAPNSIRNIVFDDAAFVYDFQDVAASTAFNNLVASQPMAAPDSFSGDDDPDVYTGSNNSDVISGGGGNDVLRGGGGSDQIDGGSGNDLLDGGLDISLAGTATPYADMLIGGAGDDVYIFGRGYGKDMILDFADSWPNGSTDTLRLQDINPDDVTLSVVNFQFIGVAATRGLEIKINDTGETVNVAFQFPSFNVTTGLPAPETVSGIEYIEFANGVVWNAQDIEDAANGNPPDYEPPAQPSVATEEDDILYGTVLDDTEFPFNDPSVPQHAINGLGGNDTIIMLEGNDIAFGGTGDDTIDGNDGDDILVGGAGNDSVYGGAGNDVLLGADIDLSTEQLIDIAGTDTLAGNAGDDTYFVLNDNTSVVEAVDEGIDTVLENVAHYTAADNVENVYSAALDPLVADTYGIENNPYIDLLSNGASAPAAVSISGNTLDNILVGNELDNQLNGAAGNDSLFGQTGNDQLNGGTGADLLVGGVGDDIYFIDDAGDVVVEEAGEGYDSVQSSVSFDASASAVEDISLTGTNNIDATGNDLDNNLFGNDGNNRLDGGIGIDVMQGGNGNDTYVVDNAYDAVIESSGTGSGTDTVEASITYTLGSNLENLTLTGTANINGTGNTKNNVITGNAGNNTLFGDTGNDTLIGGAGDDVFVVNGGDTVVEAAGEGKDRIESSVTFSLANTDNVENLTLTGSSNINGTGNALDNTIIGNSGNNTLNGGAGADTLIGGSGNDTYVYGSGDTIVESFNGGTDLVQSSINVTLAPYVENLTLTGSGNITGTGNSENNVLTGNSGNNILTGNAGNDTLYGGNGADSLLGGSGNDTYVLNRGNGADTVIENDATAGNTDIAKFGETGTAINAEQLWFSHTGNDLTVSVIGTSDKFTFTNWYAGNSRHVEQFRDSDGSVLSDSQVQNLVNAMASFTPPPAGTTTLDASYQPVLDTIAANWA